MNIIKNIVKCTAVVISAPFMVIFLFFFVIAEAAGNIYYWANGE